MLLEPSRHPLRVAMHNLLTPAYVNRGMPCLSDAYLDAALLEMLSERLQLPRVAVRQQVPPRAPPAVVVVVVPPHGAPQ